MNHAAMKALLFLVSGNFRTLLGHSDIRRLDGSVRRRMPWTTAAFTVGALSMIGIPPLAGFFSKWYLALGAVAKKQWIFLAVILASSLLNAVYFFRVIEKLYLVRGESGEAAPMHEAAPSMLIPVLVLAAALIGLGIFNAAIVNGVLGKIVDSAMF
jgi:multicomponent Na+:H+ antiporter subunit D